MQNVLAGPTVTDAELVAEALGGNRDAFGEIVDRYKSLVCSIAFSATGNLSQSEDIAQETFLSAWKSLRQLREPEKLRSWLCGIARNLVNNSLRRGRREPLCDTADVALLTDRPAPEPLPSERAISQEEQALLWRTLEQIPEIYREPLVLYYREGASVQRVAEALEISEDAVKQRLSRGRKILTGQLAQFVEGALRQSAPGRAFTFAVLASLPILPVTAGAMTAGTAAAQGVGTAKGLAAIQGLGFLTILTAIVGPIAGILGAWLGTKASLENAKSEEERRLIRRQVWWLFFFIASFVILVTAVTFAPGLKTRPVLYAWTLAALWFGYISTLLVLILRHNAAHHRLIRQHPQFAAFRETAQRFEYESNWRFLGLPLLHVHTGSDSRGRPSLARGWIAVGDLAVGFFAIGGLAFGPVAIGGISAGVISLGGAAAGLVVLAGVGIGYWVAAGVGLGIYAFGGTVIAWKIAAGGVAIARDFAVGGVAVAAHVNDALARAAVKSTFFEAAGLSMQYALFLVWLPVGLVILQLLERKKRRQS